MNAKRYIHRDFLLQTKYARTLYHEYAASMPIIDYHCHLPPARIAEDHRFRNLYEIWLAGDHYKWRAMRSDGVAEKYCTGDAPDYEKFLKWAETVPHLLRNQLYPWTHLELNRPFGINNRLLGPGTAEGIWKECNEKLALPEFSARGIMKQMNVKVVCTTDDPADTLEEHAAIAADPEFDIKVLPAFRPDKAMNPEDPAAYNQYLDRLGEISDVDIKTYADLLRSLKKRHDAFHEAGCRTSDHGIEQPCSATFTEKELFSIFEKARDGRTPDPEECMKLKSALMLEFGSMDYRRGWTMQLHMGALRNNNTRLYKKLGPDTGFDSIGDFKIAKPLSRFLDSLDSRSSLPRTVLYNLNPGDNEVLVTMIGNFQDGSVPGKMQFGSGWWFLDQKDGMERQIEALSQLGLLSRFVGMLTDSRSFLSYTRHEYFRRILCNILGNDIAQGLIPDDIESVGEMVRDISYRNAESYFGFSADENVS